MPKIIKNDKNEQIVQNPQKVDLEKFIKSFDKRFKVSKTSVHDYTDSYLRDIYRATKEEKLTKNLNVNFNSLYFGFVDQYCTYNNLKVSELFRNLLYDMGAIPESVAVIEKEHDKRKQKTYENVPRFRVDHKKYSFYEYLWFVEKFNDKKRCYLQATFSTFEWIFINKFLTENKKYDLKGLIELNLENKNIIPKDFVYPYKQVIARVF